jgi:hypothetical protein
MVAKQGRAAGRTFVHGLKHSLLKRDNHVEVLLCFGVPLLGGVLDLHVPLQHVQDAILLVPEGAA